MRYGIILSLSILLSACGNQSTFNNQEAVDPDAILQANTLTEKFTHLIGLNSSSLSQLKTDNQNGINSEIYSSITEVYLKALKRHPELKNKIIWPSDIIQLVSKDKLNKKTVDEIIVLNFVTVSSQEDSTNERYVVKGHNYPRRTRTALISQIAIDANSGKLRSYYINPNTYSKGGYIPSSYFKDKDDKKALRGVYDQEHQGESNMEIIDTISEISNS